METKAKWGQQIVGKHIDHVYIVSGKRKTFEGTVLSFDPKRQKLTIKYRHHTKLTTDNLDDLHEDFKNGDLKLK